MVGKCINKTKSNKKKPCCQVSTLESENWMRNATHARFGLVSRCVGLCWEQREQTPPSSVWAGLGRFPRTDGGRKSKQDKHQASSVTPCSVTSARSAGSYGSFQGVPKWGQKQKLKKAIADSQRLDMNRSGTHTVRSWVKMWYEVYAEPRLREKTKDYYLNYIDKHIIPELGDIKLDKLTTIQIQQFYNNLQKNGRVQRYKHIELKNKGLSARVVHGIHTLLNNCLEQAVAERLILVNPARGCKLPKMEKREMKVLPEDKIKPYLMEADKRGLLAPFYLELTTGLRRGELLALLWTDLDVENRTISITKQVNRIKGELVVSLPKTQNSVRVLPVSQQAVDLLVEEHKKHPGNPYMFPSPKTGGMFDPDSFRHTHEKILKTIGAEHIRFHDLRHTFATLSLKNGVDVKTLSSTLGHYSAGFTLSTYTHATPEMMREAADTMGDVIGKAI